jgi:hypothetical protein
MVYLWIYLIFLFQTKGNLSIQPLWGLRPLNPILNDYNFLHRGGVHEAVY